MATCNDAGLAIIRTSEGFSARSYPDPASPLARTGSGSGDPWTIGRGHTCNVHPGEVCTPAQADAWLRSDVHGAELEVARCVDVVLTPNQFSALVSWEYNTGALRYSTLLRCVNARDFAGASAQFGRWIYAQGSVMAGLVTRRAAEAHLFATP